MKRKRLFIAIAAGVGLYLLLRRKAAAAATSSTLGGFTPIGIATTYFDPGQSFDINANVESSTFGLPIN